MKLRAGRGALLLLLASALAPAPPARAGTEEFSTFSVFQQEFDDESALDHFLTRPPQAWRAEWEHAPLALRTSQGCLTSGQWFIDTDLKLRAPLGKRAWMEVRLRQDESDIASYDYLDLTWRFPTAWGTWGAMFRPLHDKARQDFALSWSTGNDTTAFEMEAIFSFEDVFNNLWSFRQTEVGGVGEPYDKRPYEPALRVATRHDHWRAEAQGQWLSASRQRITDLVLHQTNFEHERWGAKAGGFVATDLAGTTFELRGSGRQARDRDVPLTAAVTDLIDYRRQWSAEIAARRTLPWGRATVVEARWLYQGRFERLSPLSVRRFLQADDRLLNLDLTIEVAPRFIARAGGLFDRIGVDQETTPVFSYGTRNESRAYVGLIARFGRVSVQGIEGIELDPEPYPVWGVHDKGFLQLQTTF